jgi:aspartyl-tRNA(Asn)/glutamyl-tRNA(Gln) amidotransferase subunit A
LDHRGVPGDADGGARPLHIDPPLRAEATETRDEGAVTSLNAFTLTLSDAARQIRLNELSPSELLTSLLHRIDALEPALKAWALIDRVGAIAAAEQCSQEAAAGRLRGPLHGIPLGVKDIYYTQGMTTAAGSTILADFVPSYDATAVAKLKAAGAIILGKTATTEFAGFDPAATRNPWNTGHTPGGSSSGSAAAVSSGMCPAALGSQTGGSTIRPAAYCATVGLKPTYGRVSRYGVIPVSWCLDHVGLFTRTVEDAALLLEVLADHDPKDPTSATRPVSPYRTALDDPSPPRLGLLKEFFFANAQEEVKHNVERTAAHLSNAGAEVVDAPLPASFRAVHAAHRVLMMAEAAAIHKATFQTRMRDYRPQLRGMIAAGLFVPASTYLKAQQIRSQFLREIITALQGFDGFLTPATPAPAPKGLTSTGDPAFNAPWSFCGLPAITVPSGVTQAGLPLGIQLVGCPFEEGNLLRVARWCERIIGFGHQPHDPDHPT